uniref:Acyl-CoA dehydrogenase n=1 Tax=Aplanochytrium stocchinoi TaxID=215587 RepID=A0A7S3PLQ9_9STRA|mmetsp:Transcript_10147/g.13202  ORF Transcript_10147/g.13202 Transcript_10147/m.13202 type:complete len:640 (+) Transcript_10147:194-2113(+)|eukprot:CAMPEP_0204832146 /NCGR_PEP_ID=MMETSP1346-20131115/12840_1 /ASSEMBLY_ACC=CAM_ASM_000771 /TAXON_ID=215587 /ORGANISM="Aplanochytrium stocchinoi, Strain GSBS06" /LENGTH=639 /DNA_ID=CAMNT_0051963785 /DNA_START=110 /DNA_END=2029 /DNA_ORIENTATION=-
MLASSLRRGMRSSVTALRLQSKMQVRNYQAPMREIQFLMNEVNDFQEHYKKLEKTNGEQATPDMVDMILEEMAKFSENELAPLNEGADRVGCKQLGPNEVVTPPGFKEAYKNFIEGGWVGLSFPEEYGGQGLPQSLGLFQAELTATANWTWTMFPGLSKGAINTLISHGTDELKAKYLEKLVSGEWTGTMCLTEPQCGSDLGQVSTKAEPIGDGKYKITGTKIFISCGEHDFTDNILHCVLARLPDAPEGTKGISLFAVPKKTVNDDGSLGDLNKATIGRIEDKMGCHGSPTCEINFDNSIGELIGTPNRGLNHMFTFINTSRLGTAIQGLAACEASYQNALAYARDRLAMRSLSGYKNPGGPADPIIVHPAVRALLLTQKCFAEGGRAMIAECALLNDIHAEAEAAGDEKKAKKLDDRLGFLTPILKGFLTEAGLEAANMGVQVYGGHGYIKSNHQEQIVRDVRIGSIWEGTTQIQALDLLGRKVMQQKLKPLQEHCSGLYSSAWNAFTNPGSSQGAIRSHALKLLQLTADWQLSTYRIAMKARNNREAIGVASEPYLMYAGYVSLAHHWLQMEKTAAAALDKDPNGPDAKFYKSKIATARFYYDSILPRTRALKAQMFTPIESLMDLKEDEFAFNDK